MATAMTPTRRLVMPRFNPKLWVRTTVRILCFTLPCLLVLTADPLETFGSLGNMASGNVHFDEDEHGDITEYSSSFGASYSVSDDEMKSDMDSMEVDSPFIDQPYINVNGTNSAQNTIRHKQVTAEWRKVVRPIMWRCQWLELRMKDLLSQVAKYDRELAVINREKDLHLAMVESDGPKSESANQNSQSHKINIMKRRKRKRDEEAKDTSLYMKEHHTLSYYENRNNRVETDGLLGNGGFDSLVVEDIKSSLSHDDALLESIENDNIFEQYSLSEVLLTIDGIQSRICGLQGRLSNARSKYENLSLCLNHGQVKVPQNSKTSHNHLTSCKKDGKRSLKKTKALHTLLQEDIDSSLVAVPHALSDSSAECMMGYAKRNDVHEGATQSDGNLSTFEMLFGAENLLIDGNMEEFFKESADDVLIYNQAPREEEYQQFDKVNHAVERHSELVKKFGNTLPSQGQETSTHIGKCEQVQETTLVAKKINSGNKRVQKPNKKHVSSLSDLKEESEESLHQHAEENEAQKGPNNLKNEKPAFVAVNTRRSQRVRKPKIY
ncbi:hypothetical protein GUJ93_ZPchr0010g10860 [Zizania palustris]|uniref:Uncharacterized protein n=1 Tax=Zizania palustris TaxID=103762 RepID=A0A8J5W8X2_ZIZPA|nr:hypothetical protein GUJ93_ZPchr0010g10860 [Zizania palustris]